MGVQKIAIQGESGSNSHMAALEMLGAVDLVPCSLSADVFDRLLEGTVDAAVLPIENSLHGSVAEHYDLLLQHPVRITGESLLRIRFHLIAMPGVGLGDLRRVLSHPVALAQCRRFLAQHRQLEAVPFYDTAGSVKHLMEAQLRDTAGIAPELAARQYGAQILARDLEDHAENFTRFHLLRRAADLTPSVVAGDVPPPAPACNKMSVAFSIDHRPGTLVAALQLLADAGVDLTKIESRPVPGQPWEYVFYAEFRFDNPANADAALSALLRHCRMVKELGRYRSA
jgi:prephenate dehydratase